MTVLGGNSTVFLVHSEIERQTHTGRQAGGQVSTHTHRQTDTHWYRTAY